MPQVRDSQVRTCLTVVYKKKQMSLYFVNASYLCFTLWTHILNVFHTPLPFQLHLPILQIETCVS
jgi:hypothetical protein